MMTLLGMCLEFQWVETHSRAFQQLTFKGLYRPLFHYSAKKAYSSKGSYSSVYFAKEPPSSDVKNRSGYRGAARFTRWQRTYPATSEWPKNAPRSGYYSVLGWCCASLRLSTFLCHLLSSASCSSACSLIVGIFTTPSEVRYSSGCALDQRVDVVQRCLGCHPQRRQTPQAPVRTTVYAPTSPVLPWLGVAYKSEPELGVRRRDPHSTRTVERASQTIREWPHACSRHVLHAPRRGVEKCW